MKNIDNLRSSYGLQMSLKYFNDLGVGF